jgi:hypothetical protein
MGQLLYMRLPGRHRIRRIDATRVEDMRPERSQRLVWRLVGEDLARPGGSRECDDQPGDDIGADLLLDGDRRDGLSLHRHTHTRGIDPSEGVGIGADQADKGGVVVDELLPHRDLRLRGCLQRLWRGALEPQAIHRKIGPGDFDAAGSQVVRSPRQQPDNIGKFQWDASAANCHWLTGLKIDADPQDHIHVSLKPVRELCHVVFLSAENRHMLALILVLKVYP